MKKIYTYVQYYNKEITEVGVTSEGKKFINKKNFNPIIFEKSNDKTNYKDVYGNYVKEVPIKSLYLYYENYKNILNHYYCGDIDPVYQYIYKEYTDDIIDIPNIPISIIDIETEVIDSFPDPDLAKEKILSITMNCSERDKKYIIVLGYKKYNKELNEKIKYIQCNNEEELLIKFWKTLNYFSIIVGWNLDNFDIKYLVNRSNIIIPDFKQYLPLKTFWNKTENRKTPAGYVIHNTYKLPGYILYDYIELFKKFNFKPQESYSLDAISKKYLNRGKIDWKKEGYKSFNDLYENNFEKFIDYNIEDTQLIADLEDKFGYIKQAINLSYMCHINLDDMWGTIKPWDVYIYNELMKKRIVPIKQSEHEKIAYEGAFVKDSIKGLHKWVVSYDVNSLYPNIFISLNMSPLTIKNKCNSELSVEELLEDKFNLEYLKQTNESISACGHHFDISKQDPICSIIENVYNLRVQHKKLMKEYNKNGDTSNALREEEQVQTLKILINSLYGAFASPFFRWSDIRISRSTTLTGQYIDRKIAQQINKKISNILHWEKDRIVAMDTDSCYVVLDDVVEDWKKKTNNENVSDSEIIKFVISFCDKIIEPVINDTLHYISTYLNCFKNNFKMEREKIADKSIFIEKKMYILSVRVNGDSILEEQDFVYKGVDIIKTSTPVVVRDELKNVVKFIFDTNDENKLKQYINDYKKQFMSFNVDDIASPKGIKGMNNYIPTISNDGFIWKKSTPIHVRACWIYNELIKKYKIDNKYPKIIDNEKIKYVYLLLPNPIKENVIGFPNGYDLPKEFDLYQYIDWETNYEKNFLSSLDNIIKCLNWKINSNITHSLF
jgi:DNA polymerase elongation subunit (family B)